MLPLLADLDVHGDIIRGLVRRVEGLDLLLVSELDLPSTDDPDILEWAAAEGRVVISQDKSTLVGYALERVKAGEVMPGVIMCGNATIGQAIDDLELIACAGTPEDFDNPIMYLPLKGGVPPP